MTFPTFISSTPLLKTLLTRRPQLDYKCPRAITTAQTPPTRRSENVPGNFFVDSSCIDCDTCRWLAPKTFSIAGTQSAVHSQPITPKEHLDAIRAVLSCPTGSIQTQVPITESEIMSSFPIPVTGTLCETPVPDVFYNGFSSKESHGCASWLLLHRGANPYGVMFDCPRFSKPLAEAIKKTAESVGGIKYIVLSHYDDVHGHDDWAAELGALRIIHEEECTELQGTGACEVKLSSKDFPYQLADGAELLHFPGHSMGDIALLHRPSESLFTGDHLAFFPRLKQLTATTTYCENSWTLQIENVERLKEVPFLHGWPGHRRHFHFKDAEDRCTKIEEAVKAMRETKCHRP